MDMVEDQRRLDGMAGVQGFTERKEWRRVGEWKGETEKQRE